MLSALRSDFTSALAFIFKHDEALVNFLERSTTEDLRQGSACYAELNDYASSAGKRQLKYIVQQKADRSITNAWLT